MAQWREVLWLRPRAFRVQQGTPSNATIPGQPGVCTGGQSAKDRTRETKMESERASERKSVEKEQREEGEGNT